MGPAVRFPSPREAEQQEGEGAQVWVVALLMVAAARQEGSGRAGCLGPGSFLPGQQHHVGGQAVCIPVCGFSSVNTGQVDRGPEAFSHKQQDGDVHPKPAQMVVVEPFGSVENQREKDRDRLYFDTQRESCATAGSQCPTRMLPATGHVACGVLAVALSTRRFLF